MKELLLVTQNQHKVEEIKQILENVDFDLKVLPLPAEFSGQEIPETGQTFEDNARQKALFLASHFPQAYVLADDSGLCVEALDGAPGIYSARFGGKSLSYPERFDLLFQKLEEKKTQNFQAKFVCLLALVLPLEKDQAIQERKCLYFRGEIQGALVKEAKGLQGFGYDPIFYVPEQGRTMSELSAEEKNAISHRSKALQSLVQYFKKEN